MTTIINVLLGLMAGILFFGVIGERDPKHHNRILVAFISVLLFTVAFNTIM